MKGLGWDDMSRGASPSTMVDEIKFYGQLTEVFQRDHAISYHVVEELEEFFQEAMSGEYDFVTIDLMIFKTRRPAGVEAARTLRARMIQNRDPGFPIFLLSSTPEELRVDDAYNNNITPVAKNLDSAALVAQQITYRLKETGRFGRADDILIFARHSAVSLGGDALDKRQLEQLRAIVEEARLVPSEIAAGKFSLDILDELRRRIQEAGRIIVLLTCDELVARDARLPSYVARPNVYVELGLVLGVPGGNRKLVLIQEKGAYLPSDVGSHQPLVYEGELSSARGSILEALRFRP